MHRGYVTAAESGSRLARGACQSGCGEGQAVALDNAAPTAGHQYLSPPRIKNHSVFVNGRRRSVKLVVGDKPGINKKKAANAITASFVHSADAAHLQLVALAAAMEGINMVSVHD